MMKICSRCKKEKDYSEFHKSKSEKDGLSYRCKECQREVDRKYRTRRNAYAKIYYHEHKGDFLRRQTVSRQRMKKEILEHYSNGVARCAHCRGEDLVVLCLDHVNDDGAYHRRTLGIHGGYETYRRLKRDGFPEGYQVLCYNCNMRKHFELTKK